MVEADAGAAVVDSVNPAAATAACLEVIATFHTCQLSRLFSRLYMASDCSMHASHRRGAVSRPSHAVMA